MKAGGLTGRCSISIPRCRRCHLPRRGPQNTYTLVAFAHELDDSPRSDRVIAEAWDTTFTLCDGEVDPVQIDRQAPMCRSRRPTRSDPRWCSRANKSVRLFSHVVESLARGDQPDAGMIDEMVIRCARPRSAGLELRGRRPHTLGRAP